MSLKCAGLSLWTLDEKRKNLSHFNQNLPEGSLRRVIGQEVTTYGFNTSLKKDKEMTGTIIGYGETQMLKQETQGDVPSYPCVKKAHFIYNELTCFNFTSFDFFNFIALSNQSKCIFF